MPRRQFAADLKEASEPEKYPLLTNVAAGDDDGTISCAFVPQDASNSSIDIQLLIPDISDYPDSHDCMVFTTTTEEVSDAVTEALEGLQGRLSGLCISDMLLQLSAVLQRAVARSSGSSSVGGTYDSDDDDAMDVDQMSDNDEESMGGELPSDDEDDWFPKSPTTHRLSSLDDALRDEDLAAEMATRMASDLTQAKLSGFKVGYLGSKTAPIICISCRVGKLGISDEAMEAWQVDPQQYLVCMVRYIGRYRSIEEIMQEDERLGKASIDVHVDLCDSYKPTPTSAINAFNQHQKTSSKYTTQESKDSVKQGKSGLLTHSFISKPLNNLLRDRFVKILRCRYSYGFSWDGGERFFNDVQGKSADHVQLADEQYLAEEQVDSQTGALSSLVTSDHLIEGNVVSRSFPLIAMQFALRHFVRCTEFCLVCHCKTNDAFEALKPYVCSNNLCLFQYMALGFGPSLEWEILSQPYVVDLLISFTYASAKSNRLFDFPTGLGFLVPLASLDSSDYPPNKAGSTGDVLSQHKKYRARLDPGSMELVFPSDYPSRPVTTGSWIVILNPYDQMVDLHCRVRDASCWPTIRLSQPVHRAHTNNPAARQQKKSPIQHPPGLHDVIFAVYDENFDTLQPDQQRAMIAVLLETLPTVEQMQLFLSDTSSNATPVLEDWQDNIPKSALDILRWIVASNRSCIVQETDASSSRTRDDRVHGVDGYMQFRFAQGAPDKEQRFVQSVAATTAQEGLAFPTLFAWHGSPLSNWHGIVREGLHFRDTLHGRAFGNGVYMSPNFRTSCTYMGANGGDACVWPQSILRPTNAISLNEVINMPNHFISKQPHFVVSQLDWIQTRYLFVQCQPDLGKESDLKSSNHAHYYKQDPSYTAIGPQGNSIVIPMTAFSKQRRSTLQSALEKGQIPENNTQTSSQQDLASTTSKPSSSSSSLPAAPAPAPAPKKKKRLGGLFKSRKKGDGGSGGSTASTDKKESEGTDQGVVSRQTITSEFNDPSDSDDTENEDLDILFAPQPEKKGKQPAQNPQQSSSAPKASTADTKKTDFVPGTLEESSLPLLGPPTYATPGASKTLQRELKSTIQIQESHPLHELGWYVDPNLINTVYQWIVELHSFEKSLPIAKDLRRAGLKSVVMEIRFSKDYPISPPFVRVIRPRFLGFQQGGGGHVTAGGALCMELLTNSGWSAVSNIESVLLQVRMALSSMEPNPARLEDGQDAKKGTVREYGVAEAVSAYVRACRMHGWDVPPGFERLGTESWQTPQN